MRSGNIGISEKKQLGVLENKEMCNLTTEFWIGETGTMKM